MIKYKYKGLVTSRDCTPEKIAERCEHFTPDNVDALRYIDRAISQGYCNSGLSSPNKWEEACAAYTYENKDLNILYTKFRRKTWFGLALLISLFSRRMVWYLDGKFFVGKEEYKFTNDDWIGTLESPAGEQLPFIDSEGVMACRDFYCHENKAAAICKEAARILQEIHILCSKETNPFKAWQMFMDLYTGISMSVESMLLPYLLELSPELAESITSRSFVFKGTPRTSNKPLDKFPNSLHLLITEFFNVVDDYIVTVEPKHKR